MILVETLKGQQAVEQQSVEIVERKGAGHPDYVCDAVMEAISLALCKEYLDRTGDILHHNIDKGLLAAGSTKLEFGGGRITKPMQLIIGDRATFKIRDINIPVKEVAIETAKKWFGDNLRFVDPDNDILYRTVLAQGSEELMDIFLRPGAVKQANDTSAAVGFYPLSPTEQIVLDVERRLNSEEFKKRFPETGEDVKVMGLRMRNTLNITVAMPLLTRYIASTKEYFDHKQAIYEAMSEFLTNTYNGAFNRITLNFNTLDQQDRGIGGIYLSLTGTSAEDADSGQVGRGNRVNGLISINRPLGTEAAAGKNPICHVGKIYNVLAHQLARQIYENTEGVKEVYVLLLSQIGMPIDEPQLANVQILLKRGQILKKVSAKVEETVAQAYKNINSFCRELAHGKYRIC
ncbi:MAG: methionine adenosyltransferase [Desulfobacterales bacterium]|nr:MAG: methionine adenosyltransferase [Desulfobacterales bacterium]